MRRKTLGRIFQAPMVIIFAIVVIAVFYIKIFNPDLFPKTLSWATPLTIAIIFMLYLIGRRLETLDSPISVASIAQSFPVPRFNPAKF